MKHGGKRKNAGRKSKYGEKTVTVSFKCPESKSVEIKKLVTKKLKSYENRKN